MTAPALPQPARIGDENLRRSLRTRRASTPDWLTERPRQIPVTVTVNASLISDILSLLTRHNVNYVELAAHPEGLICQFDDESAVTDHYLLTVNHRPAPLDTDDRVEFNETVAMTEDSARSINMALSGRDGVITHNPSDVTQVYVTAAGHSTPSYLIDFDGDFTEL